MKLPVLLLIAASTAFCQSFDTADVHLSPPADQVRDSKHPFVAGFVTADRYVIHRATLVELIARAYDIRANTILAGPSWVDYNHYEIDAKVTPGATEAALRTMLKSLLADRFGLAVKPDLQKIDHGDIPQPVLSIVKATEQPTPNAANIATLLPALAEPRFGNGLRRDQRDRQAARDGPT